MPSNLAEWDAKHRLAANNGLAEPASIVRELLPLLPNGPALDLACGTGRHSLLLAEGSHPVTAVDGFSPREPTRRISTSITRANGKLRRKGGTAIFASCRLTLKGRFCPRRHSRSSSVFIICSARCIHRSNARSLPAVCLSLKRIHCQTWNLRGGRTIPHSCWKLASCGARSRRSNWCSIANCTQGRELPHWLRERQATRNELHMFGA
jgi:SAM-dependent methyltransferase